MGFRRFPGYQDVSWVSGGFLGIRTFPGCQEISWVPGAFRFVRRFPGCQEVSWVSGGFLGVRRFPVCQEASWVLGSFLGHHIEETVSCWYISSIMAEYFSVTTCLFTCRGDGWIWILQAGKYQVLGAGESGLL